MQTTTFHVTLMQLSITTCYLKVFAAHTLSLTVVGGDRQRNETMLQQMAETREEKQVSKYLKKSTG